MNPTIKNTIAIIVGVVVGMAVNMGIIICSPMLLTYPEGTDFTTAEGINAAIPTFEFRHFLMPFLAHALGTLAGAYTAAKIASSRKIQLALVIGVIFMVGGIIMVVDTPNSPMLFNIIDLTIAYIPMAWLGARFAGAK